MQHWKLVTYYYTFQMDEFQIHNFSEKKIKSHKKYMKQTIPFVKKKYKANNMSLINIFVIEL